MLLTTSREEIMEKRQVKLKFSSNSTQITCFHAKNPSLMAYKYSRFHQTWLLHFFPKLKKSLKGRNVSFKEEVAEVVKGWMTEQNKIFRLKDLD